MKSWSRADFEESLFRLGIHKGDALFIHSNLSLLRKPEDGKLGPAHLILKTLEKQVGTTGALYLPAFTYSWRSNDVFEPYSDFGLSQMGSLTLEAWKNHYLRSPDPMFSVLGYGQVVDSLLEPRRNSSFGEGSFFGDLIDMNIKVLLIGVGCGTTLLHEIEKRIGVPYRYSKQFMCNLREFPNRPHKTIAWDSYVRDLKFQGSEADFRQLSLEFPKEEGVRISSLAGISLVSYSLQSLNTFISKKIHSYPFFLIKAGRDNYN